MKLKFLQKLDFILIGLSIILSVVGIMFIYSSQIDADGILKFYGRSPEYLKQIFWLVAGLVIMITLNLLDYRKFERYAFIPYIVLSVLLIYLLIYARFNSNSDINGATSWIRIAGFSFQPSEFMKIALILFSARYLSRSTNQNNSVEKGMGQLKRYIIAIAIMAFPTLLTLLQPDMGTASVYVALFFIMCFFAGIPTRYIVFLVAAAVLGIFMTVLPTWETEIYKKTVPVIHVLTNKKILILTIGALALLTIFGVVGRFFVKQKFYYWIAYVFGILTLAVLIYVAASKVLKPYQIQRLIIFLDPSIDAQNSGYHIIQSRIAIGSGSFLGRGFLKGTQSHLQYLPEQSTDFIFSIIAEESGFLGCFLILLTYLMILIRILLIMKKVSNPYGINICAGVFGMLAFHFVINVGMVMGIMPITGIPLPFLSYGGTSLVTNMAALGIVMSVNARRLDFDIPV